jgi:transcriptional regulator of NAD metabolism
MTGDERRNKILKKLMQSERPMSGSALAKAFHVSRQVIVQDIALMRAERHDITSTNKGYIYRDPMTDHACPKRVFHVKHDTDQVLEEFSTITELGGSILDVAVEHELYGQIRVDLLIESTQDARDFAHRLVTCQDNPLKLLTDDCHYHTVSAPSEKLLDLIEAELKDKGFLL